MKQFSTYSIIPTEVMLDKEISSTAKILYGIISSLTNERGYCWASSKYLGDLLNLKPRQVRSVISELSNKGHITSVIEGENKRKITINVVIGVGKIMPGGRQKNAGGVGRKLPHNNIREYYNNNTTAKTSFADNKSKKEETLKETLKETPKEVQEMFNLFYETNPTINFANRTQRKAGLEVIKQLGKEKAIEITKEAIALQGKRYAPVITNPLELKDNLGKLLAYKKREGDNKENIRKQNKDGQWCIKKFGQWYLENNPGIKVDTNYYKELEDY